MNKLWKQIVIPLSLRHFLKPEVAGRCISSFFISRSNSPQLIKSKIYQYNIRDIRQKSKKHKEDSDDEEESYDNDFALSKDSKLVKFHTTSMRVDMILKASLGLARNKIEQRFYESRIRVNGKKIMKKSVSVHSGDEIDVIKAFSSNNSDHLFISRVEVLDAKPDEDSILVRTRRFKSLLIENYKDDPYKVSDTSQ